MRRCIWLVIWAVSRLGRTKAAPMDQIAFVEPQGWQQDQLVRVQHANASQFRELLEDQGFDVWRSTSTYSDIRVSSASQFQTLATSPQTSFEVLNSDLNALIVENKRSISTTFDPSDLHSFYHPLSSINSILQLFSSDYSDYARLFTISTSAQGRPIKALKVSNYLPSKHPQRKLEFVILGSAHAREWISPASMIYAMHTMLQSLSERLNKKMNRLLDVFEFTFVPVINPDGYAWSFEEDRLWRKTRQDVGHPDCVGIDLNRQWDYHFTKPYRPNPCLDSYPGETPFQATELVGIRDYLLNSTNNVKGFMDVHAFGQLLMYPFAYSCESIVKDAENLFEATLGAAKAAKSVAGKVYETGAVCDISYSSSGDSVDWTYAVANIRWSFSLELRDLGLHGFLLPAAQIRPTGEELLAILLSLGEFVAMKEGR